MMQTNYGRRTAAEARVTQEGTLKFQGQLARKGEGL